MTENEFHKKTQELLGMAMTMLEYMDHFGEVVCDHTKLTLDDLCELANKMKQEYPTIKE